MSNLQRPGPIGRRPFASCAPSGHLLLRLSRGWPTLRGPFALTRRMRGADGPRAGPTSSAAPSPIGRQL
eukprot:15461997-Alexandrium_andersonii.AAC.1